MAKAKFDKLKKDSTEQNSITHKDLQKKAGRPVGSKVKKEQANASITIALTPTQKKELEQYAKDEMRSVGSVIKMLLVKNKVINLSE
ncbi:hypothetical protein ALC152_16590 [Arcobacter sp. 15-2]|uniref:hypothetical protein n=1 Tax=Arcobacter sp. 15-2 TaxID=3374109 RepID=UPI00399CC47C